MTHGHMETDTHTDTMLFLQLKLNKRNTWRKVTYQTSRGHYVLLSVLMYFEVTISPFIPPLLYAKSMHCSKKQIRNMVTCIQGR